MKTIFALVATLALTTSPALARVAEFEVMTSLDRAAELKEAIANTGAMTDAECEAVEALLNAAYTN